MSMFPNTTRDTVMASRPSKSREIGGAGRSSEKRRHVLEHLRAHPEEVRPIRRA